jgi:hypothetical protein
VPLQIAAFSTQTLMLYNTTARHRFASWSGIVLMRLILICMMAAATCLSAGGARAQQIGGPSLLPPPAVAPSVDETLPAPQSSAMPSQIVDEILPVPETGAAEAAAAAELDVGPVEVLPSWRQPTYWLRPDPWESTVELGINGSSGTSESLSLRTGGSIKRASRFSKLNMNGVYNRTTESGAATQNNAQLDARNDWLLDDTSPWTLYGTGDAFYDAFQAFDWQISANTGIGYRFIHEPEIDLIGRMGAGTSRELGGPDDRWVPESLFGFEFTQHLSPVQKFYGKVDYYPEWEEVGEFRAVADMGWQIDFAEPSNLSLKVSASDRYDSTPNGVQPHLVNYSVLLLLKL